MLVSTSTRPERDGTSAAKGLRAVHKALLSVVLLSACSVACLGGATREEAANQQLSPQSGEPQGDAPEDEAPEAPAAASTMTWASMAKAPIAGRSAHAAVWTGSAMIVAFGVGDEGALADGARYEPKSDTWTALAPSPLSARFMPIATAIPGGAFVAFGASLSGPRPADAAIWTEASGWSALPAPPIAGRTSAAIVATDHEVIVWGGETDGGFVADGARFDLATRAWSKISPSPLSARAFHRGELSGTQMIVYGGIDSAGKILDDSASYDLATDTWKQLAVPASISGRADAAAAGGFIYGGRAIPDGEDGCPHARVDGLRYRAGVFEAIPAAPLTPRADSAAWSNGAAFFVLGGFACDTLSSDGAMFDGTTNTWTMLPAGGPSARRGATAVWTGEEAIVWGGTDATLASVADGARFKL
jgi:N-acetylneuraminic acid mutarotase